MTATFPPVLASTREFVEPELRKAVARLDEDTRRVCEYHFGWVDARGAPDEHGGKALRPALVLLSAQAGGGEQGQALRAAAAVELVHNFSLLHDDLMDGDVSRRHRPTAWTVFGRSSALLAGDALLALAPDTVLLDGTPGAVAAARSLSSAVRKLIEGQAADLEFERRADVGLDECLAMAAGKTAALLACACSMGALHVGAPREVVAHLHSFGAELGMAFQLVDDLIGLWGDPEVTGKPVLSDLRSRKKTVPVVHAVSSGTTEGARLRDLYAQPEELSEAQLEEAADLVLRAGSRAWARDESERRLARAHEHLEQAHCDAATSDFTELADFSLRRQRGPNSCVRRPPRPGRSTRCGRPGTTCSTCRNRAAGGRASCRPT